MASTIRRKGAHSDKEKGCLIPRALKIRSDEEEGGRKLSLQGGGGNRCSKRGGRRQTVGPQVINHVFGKRGKGKNLNSHWGEKEKEKKKVILSNDRTIVKRKGQFAYHQGVICKRGKRSPNTPVGGKGEAKNVHSLYGDG